MQYDDNLTADLPSFVTHLECAMTGERHEADQVHNLSRAGKPLLVRYDLEGVRKASEQGDSGKATARPLALSRAAARSQNREHRLSDCHRTACMDSFVSCTYSSGVFARRTFAEHDEMRKREIYRRSSPRSMQASPAAPE